jgi:hypothetical protein
VNASFQVLYGILGLAAVLCFVGSFAAHALLQFYIDHRKIERETGEPGWKVLGSMRASADYYKPEAEWLWKARRIGFAGFFIAGAAAAVAAVIAEILG